jgi:carbonic anhydrase/acetyltransferase-like protein (isoleucine patch superfamily)
MADLLTAEELIDMGFSYVGKNVMVSRDARLFAIEGSLDDGVRIDTYAVLTGKIRLGKNVHVSPFCFLGGTGGEIFMDDYSGMSTNVSIFTKSDNYKMRNPEKISKESGNVSIGRKSIIGSGTIILPGVSIAEYASIGCNCVIADNVEKGAIIISRGAGLICAGNRTNIPEE